MSKFAKWFYQNLWCVHYFDYEELDPYAYHCKCRTCGKEEIVIVD